MGKEVVNSKTIKIGDTLFYDFLFGWNYLNDDFIQNRITTVFNYRLTPDGRLISKLYNMTTEEFKDDGYMDNVWIHFSADPYKDKSSFYKNYYIGSLIY